MIDSKIMSYPEKLTRAGLHLATLLEEKDQPVVTHFMLFQLIRKMYAEADGQKLYLRGNTPSQEQFVRLRQALKKNGFIGYDRDYGSRISRVLAIPDQPAENIVCMVDPTCYISHLSAMQRWGLTDRNPSALLLTRPDRARAKAALALIMSRELEEGEENPYPLTLVSHPERVRRRPVEMLESKSAGESITDRRSGIRLSTIGQTFLDTLQKPDLCGGMAHVLEVWQAEAETHLSEIINSVDTATSNLVKSRAGYILEEKMGIRNDTVEAWKAFGQRGSSRKLDPSKEFAPTFSGEWMISLNV